MLIARKNKINLTVGKFYHYRPTQVGAKVNMHNEVAVYRILNIVDNKFYVGSTLYSARRWKEHTYELRKGIHSNSYLQNAWNKHSEAKFCFEILEVVSDSTNLMTREQHWIDSTRCCDRSIGYNLAPDATSPMKGRKASAETRAKQSVARLGKKKNFTNKEEWRANVKAAWVKRRLTPVSLETRGRQSESGKKKILSEDHKSKIAKANAGKPRTPAQLLAMKKANDRRVLEGIPPEVRARISKTLKERYSKS